MFFLQVPGGPAVWQQRETPSRCGLPISIRFKRANCIVCNTLRNEKWGWEEITYDMPFKKEKSLEIVIMVLKEKFQARFGGWRLALTLVAGA